MDNFRELANLKVSPSCGNVSRVVKVFCLLGDPEGHFPSAPLLH